MASLRTSNREGSDEETHLSLAGALARMSALINELQSEGFNLRYVQATLDDAGSHDTVVIDVEIS